MSNYNIMSNKTQEGQTTHFVNPYPTGPVPTAPPIMIEKRKIQSTINSNYPAYNDQSYNPIAHTRVITYEDYENYPRAPRYINGPRRQRVIIVDELDYERRREQEQREKKGFWTGIASLLCCLFCCCPGPGC